MFLNQQQKNLIDKIYKIENVKNELDSILIRSNKSVESMKKINSDIDNIISEKTKGFPWLADAIAQYHEMMNIKVAEYLQNKVRPAISSALVVRKIARERRIAEKQFRVARNLIKYYEALFPWLQDYVGENLDDLIMQITKDKTTSEEGEDPVSFYMTKAEYDKLSTTERNQMALDRYWNRDKPSWMTGRDYERYIGYLYEKDGFSVYYQGIEEGLEDLGRDLIATKSSITKIIQCKCWAQHKTIHEKHICQLFGTTLKYWVEHEKSVKAKNPQSLLSAMKQKEIGGVLITSTKLSDVAKEFAEELSIEVREQLPLVQYPSIKCNIARRTNEKIYHLPFDQQYDKVIVEKERNECYASTVAEAENLGYRRAWRWKGIKANGV